MTKTGREYALANLIRTAKLSVVRGEETAGDYQEVADDILLQGRVVMVWGKTQGDMTLYDRSSH